MPVSTGAAIRDLGLVIAGLALLMTATGLALHTGWFVMRASSATGRVVELLAGGAHPEIRFETEDGKVMKYPQGGFIFGYSAGDEVDVLYLRDRPNMTACINAFGALWFAPLTCALLGVLLAWIGWQGWRSA